MQSTVAIIIENLEGTGLIMQYHNKICGITLPSGKVDKGEFALDAAVREVEEELALTITPDDLEFIDAEVITYPLAGQVMQNLYKLKGGLTEARSKLIRNNEPDKHRWVSLLKYEALKQLEREDISNYTVQTLRLKEALAF